MSTKPLVRGDQIQLKHRLASGWLGRGMVIEQIDDLVYFHRDLKPEECRPDAQRVRCICMRRECTVLQAGLGTGRPRKRAVEEG